jgi:phospholipase C
MHSKFHAKLHLNGPATLVRGTLTLTAAACLAGFGPGALAAENTAALKTATPIQHVVIIFQENVSFDHYFATYPNAANSVAGEPSFTAGSSTPSVNNLLAAGLLGQNPNSTQPFRLSHAQNYTCDQDHDYMPEQQAFDGGLMDKFPESVGVGGGTPACDYGKGSGLTMGYYDGNTVTALWNYAQNFAMSDNSFGTTFGPSTPGALNLVAGQTCCVVDSTGNIAGDIVTVNGKTTLISDADPQYDDCGAGGQAGLGTTAKTIGDLLNSAGVTWGWFQGGFKPSTAYAGAGTKAVCASKTANLSGALQTDYSAHHEPFQYFASTANPHHLPPTSVAMIGKTDAANHQYDLTDFWNAVNAGNMPAVSFLKAKKSQDGHAGYSSPLDEQAFLVNTINQLEHSPQWGTTAVFILWDDSDGWYDHAMGPIVSQSATSQDALTNGSCGTAAKALGGIQGRCGYGPRLPFFVISPWAKTNFVDHSVTDQSSPIRFVEDNWLNGQRLGGGSFDSVAGSVSNLFDFSGHAHARKVFLDSTSGQLTHRDDD